MGNPRFQLDSSGGNTKWEIVADYRRGVEYSMARKKPVGRVIEALLGVSTQEQFFNLGREVLEKPRFHALIPRQPALLQTGSHPGPSVSAQVNLWGVAAKLDCNVGGRISKTCGKNSFLLKKSCLIFGEGVGSPKVLKTNGNDVNSHDFCRFECNTWNLWLLCRKCLELAAFIFSWIYQLSEFLWDYPSISASCLLNW